MTLVVDILVEGLLDETVARRLIEYCGHTPGHSFGKKGVNYLRLKAQGFGVKARYGNPILMLVDFKDTGLECPPAVVTTWLPQPCTNLLLRVVVPMIESWLLADREGLAAFLGVSPTLLPTMPETLINPKQALVNLARKSRRKSVRAALTPAKGVSALVGPEYVAALQEFVAQVWDVERAKLSAPSLQRAISRLQALHR